MKINKSFTIQFIKIFFLLYPVLSAQYVQAQSPVKLEYGFNGKYSYTERTNLSKYVNGKYTGLTHRETRANMKYEGENEEGSVFSGFFYVTEETLRDMKNVSLPLDEIIPTEFAVTDRGNLVFTEDNGYPRMRNFPAFPEEPVKPGDINNIVGFPVKLGLPVVKPHRGTREIRRNNANTRQTGKNQAFSHIGVARQQKSILFGGD